tara:strand:+ start:733 stop:867 length:135 start_codon:yes stop_codon:yes gene_type:complete
MIGNDKQTKVFFAKARLKHVKKEQKKWAAEAKRLRDFIKENKEK